MQKAIRDIGRHCIFNIDVSVILQIVDKLVMIRAKSEIISFELDVQNLVHRADKSPYCLFMNCSTKAITTASLRKLNRRQGDKSFGDLGQADISSAHSSNTGVKIEVQFKVRSSLSLTLPVGLEEINTPFSSFQQNDYSHQWCQCLKRLQLCHVLRAESDEDARIVLKIEHQLFFQ